MSLKRGMCSFGRIPLFLAAGGMQEYAAIVPVYASFWPSEHARESRQIHQLLLGTEISQRQACLQPSDNQDSAFFGVFPTSQRILNCIATDTELHHNGY